MNGVGSGDVNMRAKHQQRSIRIDDSIRSKSSSDNYNVHGEQHHHGDDNDGTVMDSDVENIADDNISTDDNGSSGSGGDNAASTGSTRSTSNAINALIKEESSWLVGARFSMMFLILFLTALTASGVNLFMREIEFQEFTARVSKAKKRKDDTMWKKTHLYFASFEDPYTN